MVHRWNLRLQKFNQDINALVTLVNGGEWVNSGEWEFSEIEGGMGNRQEMLDTLLPGVQDWWEYS